MYAYTIGLCFEDPDNSKNNFISYVRSIHADNLNDAKKQWLKFSEKVSGKWSTEYHALYDNNIKVLNTDDTTVPIEEFHQFKAPDMLNYSSKVVLTKIDELQKRYDIAKERLEQQCLSAHGDNPMVLSGQINMLKWILDILLNDTTK